MNYYEILGVSHNASTEEITIAFKKLVRDLHPDRYSTEKEKKEVEERFKEVTQAFNILKDPAKRKEYNKTLEEQYVGMTSKNNESSINSDQLFKKGLIFLKKEDFANAESFFQGAINRGMATSEAYYYLAMSQRNLPRRNKKIVENLENAINLDPLNVKYRLALADFFLEKGVKSKAVYHYKRVLKLDSNNKRAIQVLRNFGIIKEKSFFGKLFRNLFKRG